MSARTSPVAGTSGPSQTCGCWVDEAQLDWHARLHCDAVEAGLPETRGERVPGVMHSVNEFVPAMRWANLIDQCYARRCVPRESRQSFLTNHPSTGDDDESFTRNAERAPDFHMETP